MRGEVLNVLCQSDATSTSTSSATLHDDMESDLPEQETEAALPEPPEPPEPSPSPEEPTLSDAATTEGATPPTTKTPEAVEDAVELEARRRDARGRHVIWHMVFLIFFVHALIVWGFYEYASVVKWQSWVWGLVCMTFAGFGTTGGAHRLWTHRAYKAKLPLRVIMALGHLMSGQNSLYDWVRDHRVHHKFTETDGDPHNARRGFFFAHVGWLMQKKHPEVLRQGRKVDLSDVLEDPVIQWQERYFVPLKIMVAYVFPALVMHYGWGEPWHIAFLANLFRVVLGLNFTWSVNSAAHIYGSKPFDGRINPTDNKMVSMIALGEGWHNYHHIFPWDYKAAETTHSLNFTGRVLDLCAKVGWAYDLKTASPDMVQRVAERYGDGSHQTNSPSLDRKRKDHEDSPDRKHGSNQQNGLSEDDRFLLPEVSFPEYLKLMKQYDGLTGVKSLHND